MHSGSDVSPHSKVLLRPHVVVQPQARVIELSSSGPHGDVQRPTVVALRGIQAVTCPQIAVIMSGKEDVYTVLPKQIFKFRPHGDADSIVCPEGLGVVEWTV